MGDNRIYYCYLTVLLITWIATMRRFRLQKTALKIFSVQMGLTFITECTAFIAAIRYHNNMAIYNTFSPLQLLLILLYFNYSVPVLRRRRAGYLLMVPTIIICVLNTRYLQPIHEFNSYFLVYEGLVTVALALFSFLQMVLHAPNENIFRNPYFRINMVLVFFWSVTFLSWGVYDYVNLVKPELVGAFNISLLLVNILSCGGIGISYCLQRVLNSINGREVPH